MMTEKDVPNDAAPGPAGPEAGSPEARGAGAPGPGAAGKGHHPKPHEHFVSPGTESTRELREMARRRREAEEKLQHHLEEAHHLHEVKGKPPEGQGRR